MVKNLFSLIILTSIGMFSIVSAQTTFKVSTYNVLGFPNSSNTTPGGTDADRLAAFRAIMEDINPDVVIVQELRTSAGANSLLNELNTSSLNKTFARTPNSPDNNSGTGGNMLFYNTALFTFINEDGVPRSNTAIANDGSSVQSPRSADAYCLNAISSANPGVSTPVYFFSTHLKAGSSNHNSDPSQIPDDDRRSLGAQDIMDYIQQNLSNDDNIIVVGDMNFQDENEPGYVDFTSNPAYTELLFDPLGAWTRDAQSSVSKFTQSTRITNGPVGNGGAGGGLCDRFDFLFFNDDINNGSSNIAYNAGTMQIFGNVNINVNQSALSGTHPLRQQLYNFSDHFPVAAEFTLDTSMPPGNTGCTEYSIDTSLVFTEDFSDYTAQGFTNMPTLGQLCSNAWIFNGFSDPYIFGGVNVNNDYARGTTSGGASQGGIYAFNGTLWVQPAGSDFTPGTATMIICNDTGNTIDSLELSFDMLILNDESRANKFDCSYSLDGNTYTLLPTMSETSAGTATNTLNTFPKSINLYNLNVLPDACFYLRWTGDDVGGTGARDEFGLDNITINVLETPTNTTCPPLLSVNDLPIADGVYQANTIISIGTIPLNGMVEFKATDCIQLGNGFVGEGEFNLEIEECDPLN